MNRVLAIRKCAAHRCSFDTRWGCPRCPDEFDAVAVRAMLLSGRRERVLWAAIAVLCVAVLGWVLS